ncbi:TolC family protein [Roseateles sp.]|uniref:TolC family protein n=1 Tax=Roseateles sp. TaxID=1971397 RepID=UPI00286A9235|nr:TolC family protein [Roseateles sp.]
MSRTIIKPRLWLATLAFGLGTATAAQAAELMEVWQNAQTSDREYAVARASHAAAQTQREQAKSLWRPSVGLSASAGLATAAQSMHGAQFSAPGLGQQTGVDFNTSVKQGTAGNVALQASQPLYNPERSAQAQQLNLAADRADLELLAAQQGLGLRMAERYFDLALAQQQLRLVEQQQLAVAAAHEEAVARFQNGSSPVTDSHETAARLAGIRAQGLAARSEVQLKQRRLADSSGLPQQGLEARLPLRQLASTEAELLALEPLLAQALQSNPGLRMRLLGVELARLDASKHKLSASPRLELVAQVMRDRLSGSGDFGSASNSANRQMLGLQFSMPLYSGGYREAKEVEALRLLERAQLESELSREQVEQQVRASWLGLQVGAERVSALQESLKASEARLAATRLGREVGHRTTQELLNAGNDSLAAAVGLAQAHVALLMDRLRLAALSGNLDEAAMAGINAALR